MPTYLDFDTTKSFRDTLIARTLQRPNGPQTFTSANYSVQNLNDLPNVDPGDVDDDRSLQLQRTASTNTFKPNFFDIIENLNVFPRRANLGLYPYFTEGNDYTLIGIMTNSDYSNESELFKFAAKNIRENEQGPVFGRLSQNLYSATAGRVRFLEIFRNDGNQLSTLTNIISGKEPLIEKNYKITVDSTLPGKGIDFLQTVAGIETPFSEIPGDYLTNPRNPINNRPPATSESGALLQDITGVLGNLVGIQRRPKPTRKPSDLFIEYMGQGQRQILYDQLSYSRYAPNYTTTARSQNSSKIFNFIDRAAQGVKNLLGLEAPEGTAYIGDDRSEDVKYTMSDFNDNVVKSSYYLSLLFDPVQASLFERQRNVSERGQLSGKLTWLSRNSRNKIGLHNKEFQQFESNQFNDSKSTDKTFREGSILSKTQELLDSMPKDGISSRTHVGNVIDQTSRIFKEGESMISRGSAIKFIDQYNQETGAEYCRVWTKDRSYFNYSDTMRRTANVRKFDDSVLGGDSRPWNINYGPMSSGTYDPTGKGSFGRKLSTNIFEDENGGDGFYAKKYMFSLENLAWKTSNTPGFTYSDLPFCERGPNGGRVMWFPPYDLKVSENNSARWTDNTFLGRPEPIYTYQDTSRSGQLSFKVVVDHPSILNLLVRKELDGLSDDEADNYINSFFAGCKELDFYDLVTKYATLKPSDLQLVTSYLNQGKGTDTNQIKRFKSTTNDVTLPNPNQDQSNKNNGGGVSVKKISLKYNNDFPDPNTNSVTSTRTYTNLFSVYSGEQESHVIGLDVSLTLLSGATKTQDRKNEIKHIFGSENTVITEELIEKEKNKLSGYFNEAKGAYKTYDEALVKLKSDLDSKVAQNIVIKIESSASSVATTDYNEKLATRRSHSIVSDIFERLTKSGSTPPTIKWINGVKEIKTVSDGNNLIKVEKNSPITINQEYSFKDFGYDYDGKILIQTSNYGEVFTGPGPDEKCRGKEFKNYPTPNDPNGLKIYAPIAFYCRQSTFEMNYETRPQQEPEPISQPTISELLSPTQATNRITIDPLKRVIARVLSECFYFKKLEESDPVQFRSLKEKLKYFHPGFHSMTPEGLNSRLTFLLQCIRPGDTIPIKGISDDTDLNARNTSFGPPPVCVLRIGDFYHSKVIIRDVNISYDDNVWDLNPEGIGVQPMIATVQLSLNFIGGQGLSKPVERLQNALSSNFFGNTEMYDERSIPTNKTFNGIDAEEFTTEMLNKIRESQGLTSNPKEDKNKNTNNVNNNTFIGTLSGDTLEYTNLITDVYDKTKEYFEHYKSTYNTIYSKFGKDITTLQLSETYRPIKDYDVFTVLNTTDRQVSLFGVAPRAFDVKTLNDNLRDSLIEFISDKTDNTHLTKIFKFDKVLDGSKQVNANLFLQKFLTKFVQDKMGELSDLSAVKEMETKRNELIVALDKVNFIVKHFKDSSVSGEVVFSNTLTGYTSDFLYNEYEGAIDSIEKNTPRMYEDLGSFIDFKSPQINSQSFESIMKELLYNDVSKFENSLKVEDVVIFPPDVVSRMMKKVNNFVSKPEEKKFKFKYNVRKNDKKIVFGYSSTAEETNSTIISDAKKIHTTTSQDGNAYDNKLNFYRPK